MLCRVETKQAKLYQRNFKVSWKLSKYWYGVTCHLSAIDHRNSVCHNIWVPRQCPIVFVLISEMFGLTTHKKSPCGDHLPALFNGLGSLSQMLFFAIKLHTWIYIFPNRLLEGFIPAVLSSIADSHWLYILLVRFSVMVSQSQGRSEKYFPQE